MSDAIIEAYDDLELNYLRHLPKDKNSSILDFGCGNGRLLRYFVKQGYTKITGVDRIIYADEWKQLGNKANLIKINNAREYLDANKRTFDCIVAKDVIYYFNADEIVDITKRIKEALLPGGIVIFEIFNGSIFTGPYIKYKDIGIKMILTEHSLKYIISEAGLQIKELYGSKQKKKGIKRAFFFSGGALWRKILQLIFLVERGKDEQNPKIFTKQIIAVAHKTI